MSSLIEEVTNISNDISQKLLEVSHNSEAQKFLLTKKSILDKSLQKIIDDANVNKYEYELYILFEQCENLRKKISMKEERPRDNDEDVIAFKIAKAKMQWIRKTKFKNK